MIFIIFKLTRQFLYLQFKIAVLQYNDLIIFFDNIAADLEIEAECITRSENNILYQFNIRAGGILLLDGRATVVVNADLITSGNTL